MFTSVRFVDLDLWIGSGLENSRSGNENSLNHLSVSIPECISLPLAPQRCGYESRQGLWILSCEEATQLAYGTSVVLLRCPFVPEIMHGRAHLRSSSTSKAGQSRYDQYCGDVTLNRKKKKKKKMNFFSYQIDEF
jgi:hypothetical protein